MAKIPFTLEAWLKDKSQSVETKDGRPVKIISFELTDTNGCPIAAQFRLCAGTPVVYLFDENGKYRGEGDSDYDLFIVTPEQELTEFEKAVKNMMRPYVSMPDNIYKEEAVKLLNLARKEIMDGWSKGLRDTQDFSGKAYNDGYKLGLEEGQKEALKDLPRWRTWKNGACGNSEGIPIAIVKKYCGGYVLTDVLCGDTQYIMLSDLEKLPKED